MQLSQVGREKTTACVNLFEIMYKFNYLKKYSIGPAKTAFQSCLCPGMLKIHSGGSSSQQTVLTIPANQLKQLGVGTGSGGLQTILMPVGKGKVSFVTKKTTCAF